MSKLHKLGLLPLAVGALMVAGVGTAAADTGTATTPTVSIGSTQSLGQFLINAKGMTLYHDVYEDNGRQDCTGDCLKIFHPLFVPKGTTPTGGTGVTDKLGTVYRKNKGEQVTYDGWPLYTFAGDSKTGDTVGQNYNKRWFVVSPQPTVPLKVNITNAGPSVIFGKVDYSWKYQGQSVSGSCTVPTCTVNVNAGQQVTLTETPANSTTAPFTSWTLQMSHPKVAGTKPAISKNTVDIFNLRDTATILAAYKAPIVNIASSEALGSYLINASGMTLYHNVKENDGKVTCSGSCLKSWKPFLLPKNMKKPNGGSGVTDVIGVVNRGKVKNQITYDGWPLYVYTGDRQAGDTNGQDMNQVWSVVAPQPTVNLVVNITHATGIQYGKVDVSWTYLGKSQSASCDQQTCTIPVNADQPVTLTETPTHPGLAPFKEWSYKAVHGKNTTSSTKTSVTLTSRDDFNITAAYSNP